MIDYQSHSSKNIMFNFSYVDIPRCHITTSNIFDITCFIYAYQNLSHKIGQVYRPKLREDYLLCVDVINERV